MADTVHFNYHTEHTGCFTHIKMRGCVLNLIGTIYVGNGT